MYNLGAKRAHIVVLKSGRLTAYPAFSTAFSTGAGRWFFSIAARSVDDQQKGL